MRKLIAGNWKMNGSLNGAKQLIADILNRIHLNPDLLERAEFVVCPPYIYLPAVRHALHTSDTVSFGAQDCSEHESGAHTGDVSAGMLRDSKCEYVILGHSERRQHHGETDAIVAAKAARAHQAGLVAIICVGETEREREQGLEKDVVRSQLKASIPSSAMDFNTVIAYEPVWAIGTGKTASPSDIKAMHAFIREQLKEQLETGKNVRILYGGSMKPENAGEILAVENVDGGLIGGASLKADQFLAIAKAA